MKKITLITVFSLVAILFTFCNSNSTKERETNSISKVETNTEISFFNGTLKDALAEAKSSNKPIMIDVSTSWCGYCKKMKRLTFTDKEVADYFNENFINVNIDAEKGEGISIANKYEVRSFPTLVFIDKNEKVILYSEGYLNPKGLLQAGKVALKNLK